MKKILIILAALIAATTLAAVIHAGKKSGEDYTDVYSESSSDFLGV